MSARRFARLPRLPLLALALAPLLIQPALAEPASTKAQSKAQSKAQVKAQPTRQLFLKQKALPDPKSQDGPARLHPKALPDAARRQLETEGPAGAASDPRIQRLRELDQARGLKDIKDLPVGPAHMPERSGGLTDIPGSTLGQRGGRRIDPMERLGRNDDGGFENPLGQYAPDLPSNDGGRGRNPLVPSANPRDWMSGSASQARPGRQRINEGGTILYRTVKRENGGGTTIRHTTYDSETGEFIGSSQTTYRSDGSSTSTETTRVGTRVDSRTGETQIIVSEHSENRNADGRVTSTSRHPGHVLDPSLGDPPPRDPNPSGGGIDRTMDPDAPSEEGVALHCYAMPWQCGEIDGPDVGRGTLVNPGPVDAQGGFVPGPRINPGHGIVVNPSPDAPAQGDNWAAGRRLLEEGPRVPHSEPEDPRGER